MENYIMSTIVMAFLLLRTWVLKSVTREKRNVDETVSTYFGFNLFLLSALVWHCIPLLLARIKFSAELCQIMFFSVAMSEDYFVWCFPFEAPYKDGMKITRVYGVFRTLFTIAASYSIFTVDGSHAKLFCTVAIAVFSVAMCTYRFIILGQMMKTKSVKFTPFLVSLFMFVSPALWFVYCLLERDIFAAVPNGFATLLGVVQLIMYAIYWDRDAQPKNGSLEMGQGTGVSQVKQV